MTEPNTPSAVPPAPDASRTTTVTLTSKQVEVLKSALDVYTRLGLFQFKAVIGALDHPSLCPAMFGLDAAARNTIDGHLASIMRVIFDKSSMRVSINGGPGIHNPAVHDNFRVAFDLEVALKGDKGLVHFGSEPRAVVTTTPAHVEEKRNTNKDLLDILFGGSLTNDQVKILETLKEWVDERLPSKQ